METLETENGQENHEMVFIYPKQNCHEIEDAIKKIYDAIGINKKTIKITCNEKVFNVYPMRIYHARKLKDLPDSKERFTIIRSDRNGNIIVNNNI